MFDDFIAAAEWLIAHKIHLSRKTRDCRRQQWRAAGRRVHRPNVPIFSARRSRSRCDGHAALSQVHDWLGVDLGLRLCRQRRRIQGAVRATHRCTTSSPGTQYPPTLITTADHDDRVVPAHSFKFAATLQAAQAGDKPVLIRIETKAGHGAGKPTSKIIEEAADRYAFLVEELGMAGPR